jgi:hypothetical protein
LSLLLLFHITIIIIFVFIIWLLNHVFRRRRPIRTFWPWRRWWRRQGQERTSRRRGYDKVVRNVGSKFVFRIFRSQQRHFEWRLVRRFI